MIDLVIDRMTTSECDLIEAKSGDKTRIPSIFE